MAECEFQQHCSFFNEPPADEEQKSNFFRELYCAGNNSICARYMVSKQVGPEFVPETLSPNNVIRAKQILKIFPPSTN